MRWRCCAFAERSVVKCSQTCRGQERGRNTRQKWGFSGCLFWTLGSCEGLHLLFSENVQETGYLFNTKPIEMKPHWLTNSLHPIFTEEKIFKVGKPWRQQQDHSVIRISLYLYGSLLVLFYVVYLTSIAKKFNLAFDTFRISCCNPVKKSWFFFIFNITISLYNSWKSMVYKMAVRNFISNCNASFNLRVIEKQGLWRPAMLTSHRGFTS